MPGIFYTNKIVDYTSFFYLSFFTMKKSQQFMCARYFSTSIKRFKTDIAANEISWA